MAALVQLPQTAGVSKGDVVRVTGPNGLRAMYWLNRLGYRNAAYVHPRRVATMPPVDALLVPHPCSAQELDGLIHGGACVREGGVLIVQTTAAWAPEGGDTVTALLLRRDFRVEARLSQGGCHFCVARRQAFSAFTKVA